MPHPLALCWPTGWENSPTSSGASGACSRASITSPSQRCASRLSPSRPRQFMRWLLRWQHLAPQSQLAGERGLLQVLRQLQGFEIPANAWEKHILARRVNDYDPAAARPTLPHRRRRLGHASHRIPRHSQTRRRGPSPRVPPASHPSPSSSAKILSLLRSHASAETSRATRAFLSDSARAVLEYMRPSRRVVPNRHCARHR